MAAPLLHAINGLNQEIADRFTSTYYHWDSKKRYWFVQRVGFGKHFDWLNWHRLSILTLSFWYLITGIYAWVIWTKVPGILKIQDVALIALVGISVIPLVLLLEYGYMKHAVVFCGFNNWGIKKLEELTNKRSKSLEPNVFRIVIAGIFLKRSSYQIKNMLNIFIKNNIFF